MIWGLEGISSVGRFFFQWGYEDGASWLMQSEGFFHRLRDGCGAAGFVECFQVSPKP